MNAGRSEVQSQPLLLSRKTAQVSYLKPYLKKKKSFKQKQGRNVARLMECLPNMHEALWSVSNTT
jgi:hypothetical protein